MSCLFFVLVPCSLFSAKCCGCGIILQDTLKVIDRFRTGLLPPDDVEVEDPSAGKSSTLQRPEVPKNATISKKRNIFTLLRGQKVGHLELFCLCRVITVCHT